MILETEIKTKRITMIEETNLNNRIHNETLDKQLHNSHNQEEKYKYQNK